MEPHSVLRRKQGIGMSADRIRNRIASPWCACLTLAAAGISDTTQGQRRTSEVASLAFKGGVDLVAVDVCVLGPNGKLLSSLEAEECLVLEDDVPQRVSLLSPSGDVPLATVLLLDQSASMYGAKVEQAKEAALAFIGAMTSDDRVGVLISDVSIHQFECGISDWYFHFHLPL